MNNLEELPFGLLYILPGHICICSNCLNDRLKVAQSSDETVKKNSIFHREFGICNHHLQKFVYMQNHNCWTTYFIKEPCLTWYVSYAEFKIKNGVWRYLMAYCGKKHCLTWIIQVVRCIWKIECVKWLTKK
jgi:hypothetical protein